ncbi:MAG: TIGR03086 family protein [Chloroflexi bacterium]|nr:TIGR03086 family protein [Chloroflexota bacterium]
MTTNASQTHVIEAVAVDLLDYHQRAGSAYDESLAQSQAAFSRAGALERTCVLSYGEVSVAMYCRHRALDTLIHGWDIARATGQDDRLDPALVELTYAIFAPHAADFATSPAFGRPLTVGADADTQTRVLAMLGRDNRP